MDIKIKVKQNKHNIDVKLKDTIVVYRESGREPQTKEVEYVENGEYVITPDEGYILEQANVNVNVPIPEGYVKPDGTLDITENGEVDVKPYASVKVNIDTRLPEQEKTLDVSQNGTYNIIPDKGKVLSAAFVNVNVPDIPAVLQEKSITPTKNVQYLTPDSEYEGMSKVTIEPIPDNYIEPIGTKVLTENGKVDITEYKFVDVDVQPDLENIEITPTKEEQHLKSENAYGFNDVVVKPIPDEYIIPKDVLDITKNGEVDVTKYAKANVNIDTAKPEQSKNTVPTKNTQTILPDEGYVLNEVTVYPIPEEYIVPEGTLDITKNGEYNVADKESVNVKVASSGGEDMLQTRVNITKSCDYLFYTYSGDNLDYIANLDTSNVTSMVNMFRDCKALTTIPQLNTSNVTNVNNMFYNCQALISIPQLDTSSVTNISNMFYNCSALTSIPQLDTSSVTNMNSMFYNCSALTSIPQLDTSKVGSMTNMFYNCSALITIPQLDTSKVGNMYSMFYNCSALIAIPQLDTSRVTNISKMFYGCASLKSILMYGMKVDFDISASTQFETEDLVTILNNLATVTITRTLTMGTTNLAKLSDEQKQIAINKGWTLA